MNTLKKLKNFGHPLKKLGIGFLISLKKFFLPFVSSLVVVPFLFSSVFARTVDARNIEDFFVGARFGSYSSYPDQSFADDVYSVSFGSMGMYQDTLSAEFLPSSQFDNMIVEDGFGVYYCYLYGNTPVQTLKKGSTLEISINVSFNNPLMFFQPTNCHFTLYPSRSNIENIVHSGDVSFDYVSTEGYEKYFGDQSLAPKTRSASLSFTFTAPEDIPLSHHTLSFVNNYLPNQSYQFTNDFHCSFDLLSFHYTDDEVEIISSIDQNFDRLIGSMTPSVDFGADNAIEFGSLDLAEKELLDKSQDGVNAFNSLSSDLIGFFINDSHFLFRAVTWVGSFSQRIIETWGGFRALVLILVGIGVFPLIVNIGASAFKRRFK